jgi:hypothetical protein
VGGRIATDQRDMHRSADEKTHKLWEGELQQVRETCTHLQIRKLTCCGRGNCDRSERDEHTSTDEKTHVLWEENCHRSE